MQFVLIRDRWIPAAPRQLLMKGADCYCLGHITTNLVMLWAQCRCLNMGLDSS